MAELGRREHDQECEERGRVAHPKDPVPCGCGLGGEHRRDRVSDEGPHLEVGAPVHGDPGRLGEETAHADRRQQQEDPGVFGPGLGAQAPRTLDVAPHEGPQQTRQEHESREIEDQRVTEIEATLQELEGHGQQVVHFEGGRAEQEHDEPVVDHRVHEAGLLVSHQRPHPQALFEAAQAFRPRAGSVLWPTSDPVLGPERKQVGGYAEE